MRPLLADWDGPVDPSGFPVLAIGLILALVALVALTYLS